VRLFFLRTHKVRNSMALFRSGGYQLCNKSKHICQIHFKDSHALILLHTFKNKNNNNNNNNNFVEK